jgi:hypothetical protein
MFMILYIFITFHAEFLVVYVIYLDTKFHISSSKIPVVIVVKMNARYISVARMNFLFVSRYVKVPQHKFHIYTRSIIIQQFMLLD